MGWEPQHSIDVEIIFITNKNSGQKIQQKIIVYEECLSFSPSPKGFDSQPSSQLVDLQIFTAPRVALKPLVPAFPCFSNIVVSLLEKV